jgi:hypothetical protein
VLNSCKKHLHTVNESYLQHMSFALYFGGMMIVGGFGAILHALCPAIFQTAGSKTVNKLHATMHARMVNMQNQNSESQRADF